MSQSDPRYTVSENIELMKILHCLSMEEFYKMMDRRLEQDPGEYIMGKYMHMKRDMFSWLCELDEGNCRRAFKFAESKQIWNILNRRNL